MLPITDAEHLRTVAMPAELAQSVGVFKDMIDSVGQGGQSEPVVLDESPEVFDLFVAWLFHRPEFTVTADNVARLLEVSHKYEIPTLGNDIGFILNSYPKPILGERLLYTLGACFGAKLLEDRYRRNVVENFDKFLVEGEGFGMLSKWCPEKLLALVTDAMAIRNQREKDLKEAFDMREHDWKDELDRKKYFVEDPEKLLINTLVSKHCKAALSRFNELTDAVETTKGPYAVEYCFSSVKDVKEARELSATALKAISNFEYDRKRKSLPDPDDPGDYSYEELEWWDGYLYQNPR